MEAKPTLWRLAMVLLTVMLAMASGRAAAHSAQSYATLSMLPGYTVAEGTDVTLVAEIFCSEAHLFKGEQQGPCVAAGQAVTSGSLHIQAVVDDLGQHMDCSYEPPEYAMLGQGSAERYSLSFDTSGMGGQTLGFRVHYVPSGGGGAHKASQAKSDCVDLVVTLADPLPDGTLSYGQGFYGASPVGESLVAGLLDGSNCAPIHAILSQAGLSGLPGDCSDAYWADLALYLTGTVGSTGGNRDGGFLPAGNPSFNGPGLNLAAQKITLLLNLNLGLIPAYALQGDYYLNIDPVQDYVGGAPAALIDPVFHHPELYLSCDDDGMQHCSNLVLSALGELVVALDEAGTRVQAICDAALNMLLNGLDAVEVNGIVISRGDMTALLEMINESYAAGQPTGFVTAWDVD